VTETHYAHGKICYLEIPATDVQQSAAFYERVFGWSVRERGDGSTSFDDTVGQVSGTWVTGRAPMREAGVLVSIMVADAAVTLGAIEAAGGEVMTPVDPASPEVFATFRDPAGNLFCIYQDASLAATAG
jgi:predicted enzyme related to lactoylglutathione lyase